MSQSGAATPTNTRISHSAATLLSSSQADTHKGISPHAAAAFIARDPSVVDILSDAGAQHKEEAISALAHKPSGQSSFVPVAFSQHYAHAK